MKITRDVNKKEKLFRYFFTEEILKPTFTFTHLFKTNTGKMRLGVLVYKTSRAETCNNVKVNNRLNKQSSVS